MRPTKLETRKTTAAISINHSPAREQWNLNNGLTKGTSPDDLDNGAPCLTSASNGGQNIALAHLLVTHILLWLMKLNSISLIQPLTPATVATTTTTTAPSTTTLNEDQSASSIQVWQQQRTNLSNNLNRLTLDLSSQLGQFQQSPDLLDIPPNGADEQDNRAKLENILRRKIPTTLVDHNKTLPISWPNNTGSPNSYSSPSEPKSSHQPANSSSLWPDSVGPMVNPIQMSSLLDTINRHEPKLNKDT